MSFMVNNVPGTILQILDDLLAAHTELPDDVWPRIQELVHEHGPIIANEAGGLNTSSKIAAFLDALLLMRSQLPSSVVAVLISGQQASGVSGSSSLSSETYRAVLVRLIQIADFRVFDNPIALAKSVDDLVAAHTDRLTDAERDAWHSLNLTYRQESSNNSLGASETYLRAVESLLRHYPSVWQLLEAGKIAYPGLRRRTLSQDLAYSTPVPKGLTAEVNRFANVHFPAKVLASQENIPLVVHVAGEYQEGARIVADQVKMSLNVGELRMVLLVEGFKLVRSIGGRGDQGTPAVRIVDVKERDDCEPVVYFLTPLSVGHHKLTLDFYQRNDRPLLSLAFETEVVSQFSGLTNLPAAALDDTVPLTSPQRGPEAPPPDLELRVTLSGTILSYYLHSPGSGGYNHQAVGKVDLFVDPLTFLKPTFDTLNTLAKQPWDALSADERSSAQKALADIGNDLWRQLFPEEEAADFRQEYRKIRQSYQGRGLLIMSDETWIPWEVVKPYEIDAQGEIEFDDEPFCERFRLARWFAGRPLSDQVKMQRAAWVASADNLEAVKRESDYFRNLYTSQWQLVSMNGPLTKVPEVDQGLASADIQLFHFACHGSFDTTDPNDSRLKLADGFFTPKKIGVAAEAGLRRSKPMLFLNACHGGRTGVGLTQIGGWAPRLIKAGASAFIGGLWEVNDQLAAQFTVEFYDRLWGVGACTGQEPLPLGKAFHEARMAIKRLAPGNPTWLAYVLYGDPYGQVVLGG